MSIHYTSEPAGKRHEAEREQEMQSPELEAVLRRVSEFISQIIANLEVPGVTKSEMKDKVSALMTKKLEGKSPQESVIFLQEMEKAMQTFFGLEYRSKREQKDNNVALFKQFFADLIRKDVINLDHADDTEKIARDLDATIEPIKKSQIANRMDAFKESLDTLYGEKERLPKSRIFKELSKRLTYRFDETVSGWVDDGEIHSLVVNFLDNYKRTTVEDPEIPKSMLAKSIEEGMLRMNGGQGLAGELEEFRQFLLKRYTIEDLHMNDWFEGNNNQQTDIRDLPQFQPRKRAAVVQAHQHAMSPKDLMEAMEICADLADGETSPGQLQIKVPLGPILKPASLILVAQIIGALKMGSRFLITYGAIPEISVTSTTQAAVEHFNIDKQTAENSAHRASDFLEKFIEHFYPHMADNIEIDLMKSGAKKTGKGKIVSELPDLVQSISSMLTQTQGLDPEKARGVALRYLKEQFTGDAKLSRTIAFYNESDSQTAGVDRALSQGIQVSILSNLGPRAPYGSMYPFDVEMSDKVEVARIAEKIRWMVSDAMKVEDSSLLAGKAETTMRCMSLIAEEVGAEKFIKFLEKLVGSKQIQ